MNLNFSELMLPVKRHSVFAMEDWCVWCGALARTADGVCHLIFSRWPKHTGHNGWVTHSEFGYATADNPLGPYVFQGVALQGAGGDAWDRDVVHNATLLEAEGKYYLYYMGNYGNGEYWDHRNHQRVGVAVADHPAGPWQRFDTPCIDVTPGSHDALMTSNPSVTRRPDGRFLMVHKAVGLEAELPRGGPVVCGVAIAEHPLGPWVKHPEPIMVNPEAVWSVEDPFLWHHEDGWYYALLKDFQGYFSGAGKGSNALFASRDGLAWQPARHPAAYPNQIVWEDGEVQPLARLERQQLWFENGRPRVLLCAAMIEGRPEDSFNVQIPLRG